MAHRTITLPVHIWYPARQAGDAVPALLRQTALFHGAHVPPEANTRPGPAPVVVMSHGFGGSAVTMTWLAAYLKRQGMIAIATVHADTGSQDGDPQLTPQVCDRAADLSALLDWLAQDAPYGLTPDIGRVASRDFSLEGRGARRNACG